MLTGYVTRLRKKSNVSTTQVAAPKAPVQDLTGGKDDDLIEVTVAPRKTIGRGLTAKGPGQTLEVTRLEARRLKTQGFIV